MKFAAAQSIPVINKTAIKILKQLTKPNLKQIYRFKCKSPARNVIDYSGKLSDSGKHKKCGYSSNVFTKLLMVQDFFNSNND